MTPLTDKALKIAHSQIGKQELPKGSNAGTDVEKYLKSVELGKGFVVHRVRLLMLFKSINLLGNRMSFGTMEYS